MEPAIKKAIEGGYTTPASWGVFPAIEKQLLDPLFWSALGKALGWEGYYSLAMESNATEECIVRGNIPKWRYQMISFMNHLAEGKDADSFFDALLNTTK